MPRTWTREQFEEAVSNSRSVAQTLKALSLRPVGGNYATVHRMVKEYGLDTSHWGGQAWSKGQTLGPSAKRRSLSEILVKNSPHRQSHSLKLRLLSEQILENECAICKTNEWLDKPLSLHLDHVNGNHSDNRISNLRLLCPNCHSQTETYCGKNNGRNRLPLPLG